MKVMMITMITMMNGGNHNESLSTAPISTVTNEQTRPYPRLDCPTQSMAGPRANASERPSPWQKGGF